MTRIVVMIKAKVAKIIAVMTTPVTLVDEHEGTVKQNGRNGIVCGNRMNTVAS